MRRHTNAGADIITIEIIVDTHREQTCNARTFAGSLYTDLTFMKGLELKCFKFTVNNISKVP
jgi:hypothetical protein